MFYSITNFRIVSFISKQYFNITKNQVAIMDETSILIPLQVKGNQVQAQNDFLFIIKIDYQA